MAKLTARTELNATPASGDLVHIVDVSDTTDNASGTSKKITVTNLLSATSGLSNVVEDTTPQLGGDLDAQSNDITAVDNFKFDTSPTTPLTTEGSIYWDATDHTIAIKNDEADVTMQVGQELYTRVRNETGGTITNGQVVYISGSETGGESRPLIALAQADAASTAAAAGIATHDIETASYGYITPFGLVNDLNTSAFTAGDPLYLDPDTAGAFTASRPISPNFIVPVGVINVVNASTGNILVAIASGAETPAGDATELVVSARKGSAGTITAGQVVYQSGWNVGQSVPEVELADADGSGTMPAIGIARDTITNSTNGDIVFAGRISGIDTSTWSVGDALYVSTTAGTLTNTRPTAATASVQKVGVVLRSNASNGIIEVVGAGRTNDIPNKMSDAIFKIHDDGDDTKLINFQASGITTGTTRTITMPDSDIDLTNVPTSGEKTVLGNTSGTNTGDEVAAVASELNTGTDTTKYVTADALAGSNTATRVVTIIPFLDSEDTATGDGAGDVFWRVPSVFNGMDLVAVAASVQTAGTTGTTDVQIHNVTQAADMLTTKITIDSAETDSSTAATAAVIDTANDDVATGDSLRIDVDAVSTTPAKGLLVELQFRLP